MKKKHKDLIMKILRIKINLMFLAIFGGAMLYSADKLGEAILLREIFFWAAILLIIMFQVFDPMKRILDTIQEWVVNKKDAKGENTE